MSYETINIKKKKKKTHPKNREEGPNRKNRKAKLKKFGRNMKKLAGHLQKINIEE